MKPSRPQIDANTYKTPTGDFKDEVACAVMHLTAEEARVIEALAGQLQRSRGETTAQSFTLSWMPIEAERLQAERNSPRRRSIYDAKEKGWFVNYNVATGCKEFIAPDGEVYTQDPGNREVLTARVSRAPVTMSRAVDDAPPRADPVPPENRFSGLELSDD